MNLPTSFKRLCAIVFTIALGFGATSGVRGQDVSGKVLILYDGTGDSGWLGNVYAKMLANLLGHFQLSYQIMPVESYTSNDVNVARATFYLGTIYDNALPPFFKSDVVNTTNTVCWMKYNIWQLDWDGTYSSTFESRYGLGFFGLDSSGYSNIVYKGQTLDKSQYDPELGYAGVLDPGIASTYASACKDTNTCISYVIKGGNFWYVADNPFAYMAQEDRYLAFADLMHDILEISHTTNHQAYLRIHSLFDTNALHQFADYLNSSNVPYGVTVTPNYKDPLGAYGAPQDLHLTNALMQSYVDGIKYMITNNGQIVLLGYTHQYAATNNPYTGATWDDYEFWREKFQGNTNQSEFEIYQPVDEDTNSWVQSRLVAATNELGGVNLQASVWMTPYYYASALDYRNFATNFPTITGRSLYFADDYTYANQHLGSQLFPYFIHQDVYGQRIVPENIGNILPAEYFTPAVNASDLIRIAQKNLVVRDGWASGYMSAFYNLTNLQALVSGIQALGYTYVSVGLPVIAAQPQSQLVNVGNDVTFRVVVSGMPTLNYQWYFNDVARNSGTNTTLAITNAQTGDAGNYTVIITNSFGAVTSTLVTLTFNGVTDADGNGLADAWELQYFDRLGNSASADPDGDGWTNLQEYQNGTNPNVVDQPLKVTITRPFTTTLLP